MLARAANTRPPTHAPPRTQPPPPQADTLDSEGGVSAAAQAGTLDAYLYGENLVDSGRSELLRCTRACPVFPSLPGALAAVRAAVGPARHASTLPSTPSPN